MKSSEIVQWIGIIILIIAAAFSLWRLSIADERNIELSGQINILLNQTPLSKPMMEFQFTSWGETLDNDKEYTLTGFIWNYGEIEANNVEVTCAIFNKDKKIIDKKVENLGSVASNSWTYKAITMPKKSETNIPSVSAICYYTNSSNGYALEKNIKEYKEFLEKVK